MCNCVKNLEERIKNHLVESKKYRKPVLSVRMQGKAINLSGPSASDVVTQDFEITLEGQKKKPSISVAHSYCPFCGEEKEG